MLLRTETPYATPALLALLKEAADIEEAKKAGNGIDPKMLFNFFEHAMDHTARIYASYEAVYANP